MKKYEKEILQSQLDMEAAELKKLKAIYMQAADDCAKKIKFQTGKIDVLLNDWDDLGEKEKSILQSQIYQRKYQQALQKQISEIIDNMNNKQYATVSEYLTDCYENGFASAMYSLHKQGVPIIMPLDQKAVVKGAKLDSKVSKKLYGSYVTELKKHIRSEVSRGVATSLPYKDIARNLNMQTNIGLNKAMRIARTEGHNVQVSSSYETSQRAKEKGADVLKQWSAALDGRTRESHARVDGEIRELDEKFSNGLKYPGDSAGGASEVVNCRCALLQRAKWALDEEELQTLKERAAYYGLDKTKDFDDFKKKYLKAADKAEMIKYDEDRQAQIKARREAYFARKAAKQGSIPDFTNMEYADVIEWADSNLKTTFEDLKGTNKDFVKETVKALATFESKMGGTIDGLSVKFGGLSGNLFAKYDDKTKTLLLKKTGSLKAFEDKLKDENARYRAKWKRDKDYNATDTFSGTVLHELGHAVDIDTGQSLSRKLGANKELYSKSLDVSAYAGTQMNVRATKASEAWAENFAAYMAGGANAKKVPDEVKEMIEDYFKTKKAQKVVEKVKKPVFIPAKTTEEAENFAKQFVVEKTWSGNGNVSYKGLSLESANKFNETLLNLYEQNDIHLLNNIQPMNFRQTIWKGSETTPMAYRSAGDGDLFFNPKIMKNAKSLDAYMEEGRKAFKTCAENIDKFKGTDRELIETYLKAGSSLVAETTDDAMKTIIEHEMGHHIQHSIIYNSEEMAKIVADGFEEYGVKISGYATKTKGEYIAESYAAFCNGKAELIDPKLKDIFENIRKTGRN